MNRRQFVRLVAASAVPCGIGFAAYWGWDHRGYLLADNLRVVEPGRIVAGGYQYPIPLKGIISRYHIRTVVSLREGEDNYEARELELLRAMGVRYEKVVIPYKVSDEVRISFIEQAVNLITDRRNQPVFVHCWAGCHRTGAVVAIYRVSRCGWSEEAARKELVDWGGTALGTEWPSRVLAAYARSRPEFMARNPQPTQHH